MASRAVVARQSAAWTPKQQSVRLASARPPAFHQETLQPESAPVPFDFGGLHLFAPGEPQSSPRPRATARGPLPWPIQARLAVGAVSDPLEREADQVADRIMRMPHPAFVSAGVSGQAVQRACAACAEEQDEDGQTVRRMCRSCSDEAEQSEKTDETPGEVSRKEAGRAAALDGTAAPGIVREVVRSPGRLLDPATRAFFEPRFGHGFSRVRIHTDARAAASAQAVNALAYTVGKDVVFGASQFAPHTTRGRDLLAHELAHVVQQGAPGARRIAAPVVWRQASVTVEPGGCDLDQHRKIEPAAHKANEWLSRAIPAVEAFLSGARTPPAQAVAAALTRHFHSLDVAVVRYVRDRLTTIQGDIFGRRNFRVKCPPASDRECEGLVEGEAYVAVVPAGNPNEVNLCAPFFERKEEDRASTIIHEFGHTHLGLSARQAIVDRAYQRNPYYFYLTTGEALTNAESYAMFAREVATGFSPAKGFIVDSLRACPDAWVPIISDAITKARMWNHRAALNPVRHEFSGAYIALDGPLMSSVTFKCIPEGGGRCGKNNVAYWYALTDLRICPGLIELPTPDDRGLAVLASLYAYQGLVDGDERQDRAAREARRLHAANVPSTADVLSGR